jgi:hypothetical protein
VPGRENAATNNVADKTNGRAARRCNRHYELHPATAKIQLDRKKAAQRSEFATGIGGVPGPGKHDALVGFPDGSRCRNRGANGVRASQAQKQQATRLAWRHNSETKAEMMLPQQMKSTQTTPREKQRQLGSDKQADALTARVLFVVLQLYQELRTISNDVGR